MPDHYISSLSARLCQANVPEKAGCGSLGHPSRPGSKPKEGAWIMQTVPQLHQPTVADTHVFHKHRQKLLRSGEVKAKLAGSLQTNQQAINSDNIGKGSPVDAETASEIG